MSQLTPAALEVYRRTARERSVARQQRMTERRERAWAVARRAATLLKEEFGAKQVKVFGSLTVPSYFHAGSDLDLAVWGMDERRYFEAAGRLLDFDADFSIDLVEFEQARPSLQAAITQEGISL